MLTGAINLYPNISIVIAMVPQRKRVRNLQFVVLRFTFLLLLVLSLQIL